MITITPMTADQYDQVVALWLSVTEIGFSPSFDTRERIVAYLWRNPGYSTVRWTGCQISAVMLSAVTERDWRRLPHSAKRPTGC